MKRIFVLMLLLQFLLTSCVGLGGIVMMPETRTSKSDKPKSDIIKQYGEPSRIEKVSELEEVLIYDEGWRWNGIVVIAGLILPIPIPLIIPTGTKSSEYRIRQGQPTEITSSSNWEKYCFAGYAMVNENTGAGTMVFSCAK